MANLIFRKAWDHIRESEATAESLYLNRREVLKRLGFGGLGLGGLLTSSNVQAAGKTGELGPYGNVSAYWSERWSSLFPPGQNRRYPAQGPVTEERLFAGHNNFYEFTMNKTAVKDLVGSFETHPWRVDIRGRVEHKGKYDLDDLIRMGTLEERIYHHRCVEAWSANIPWIGYPLSQLIQKLNPSSDARYVKFKTILKRSQMPGQRGGSFSWPYYEAISMEEAMNELALLAFGIYGHPLNKQNGAPVRMVLPWKYGFKSIKSIVRIEFVKTKPGTFWSDGSREYGFWANVNPSFSHPRWSQATERILNNGERIPTQIYNGYHEFVGHLYDESDRRYYY